MIKENGFDTSDLTWEHRIVKHNPDGEQFYSIQEENSEVD